MRIKMYNKIYRSLFFIVTVFFSYWTESVTAGEPKISDTLCSPTACYTIQAELGEGVFGKVFAVVDGQGQRFAIKWYKEQANDDLTWLMFADVEREFARGQALDHPNIIKTHELFADASEKNHYLVLEYVNGETFWALPRKSLTRQQALTASKHLIEALQYAFGRGYLYLDVHPHNFMLTHDNRVKIIDLAGFFTWEELAVVFRWKEFSEAEGDSLPKENAEEKVLEKKIEGLFAPKRAAILKRFFKKNPQAKEMIHLAVQKNDKQSLAKLQKWLSPFYINEVTESPVFLLSRSEVDKENRIEQRIRLKKVAWDFLEDTEDGTPTAPVDDYFERAKEAVSD